MGYTAMRGGLEAIERAEALLTELVAGAAPDLSAPQVRDHMRGAVDRAMGEGGLYDPDLGGLSVRQAEGDPHEAALLLRAYRSTLRRIGYSEPSDGAEMEVVRRITPAFKNTPGGHVLGRTRDYSQRLLDFGLMEARQPSDPHSHLSGPLSPNNGGTGPGEELRPNDPQTDRGPAEASSIGPTAVTPSSAAGTASDSQSTSPIQMMPPLLGVRGPAAESALPVPPRLPRLTELLRSAGLAEDHPTPDDGAPYDVTLDPLRFPAPRSARLQALARGETGAMTALAYSTMRGHGAVHSTIAELRVGFVPLRIRHPYTGVAVRVGEVEVTEVEDMTLSRHTGADAQGSARFGLGYGMLFGQNERKAIAMALLDRAIDSGATVPAADEEFVLFSIDGVEATGFVEHLKLPHYVEFQAMTQRMRVLQERLAADGTAALSAVLNPSADRILGGDLRAATGAEDAAHLETHALGVEHGH